MASPPIEVVLAPDGSGKVPEPTCHNWEGQWPRPLLVSNRASPQNKMLLPHVPPKGFAPKR